MRPYIVCFIFSVGCLGFGLWEYFDLRWIHAAGFNASPTALIPVAVGAIILLMTPSMKMENRSVLLDYVVVGLAVALFFGLVKLLLEAIERGASAGIFRVAILAGLCVWVSLFFIKQLRTAKE